MSLETSEKSVYIALFVGIGLVLSIWVFFNLYSETSEYKEKEKQFYSELNNMSCKQIFAEIRTHIAIGYTVGLQGTNQQTYIDEFEKRGCINE